MVGEVVMDNKKKSLVNENMENDKTEVEASGATRGKSNKISRDGKKNDRNNNNQPKVDIEERVVSVSRVAKVVKGGRRFSFAALIVVGDKGGRVGYGLGKAKEVPDAIRKAGQQASKKMISVQLDKGTIPHEIIGKYGAGVIMFKPAAEGTGIKAAGACRSILELAGVKNVITKSLRGNNPHNIVKATFSALSSFKSCKEVAATRGIESGSTRLK